MNWLESRSAELEGVISLRGEGADLLFEAIRVDDDEFITTCMEKGTVKIIMRGRPRSLRRAFDDLIRCLMVAEKTLRIVSRR